MFLLYLGCFFEFFPYSMDWIEPVDLRDCSLHECVDIGDGEIIVYPNEETKAVRLSFSYDVIFLCMHRNLFFREFCWIIVFPCGCVDI